MKLLTRIVARKERGKVVELEAQLQHIAAVVDGFYALLGPRNWAFDDDLNLERVGALVSEGRLPLILRSRGWSPITGSSTRSPS